MRAHVHELYDDRRFIGFCGSADEHDARVESFIRDFVVAYGAHFVGVCGGTTAGVPGIVASTLASSGVPIVGVVPSRGEHKTSPHLNHVIAVPPRFGESCWGDESEILVKLCDAIVFFGGGWGTMIELSHAMKINQMRVSHNEQPICLALLTSFGGALQHAASLVPPAPHVYVDATCRQVAAFLGASSLSA